MKKLLKQALLTFAGLAIATTYIPVKSMNNYLGGTQEYSTIKSSEKVEDKNISISPYLEYQNSIEEASKLSVKVKHKIGKDDSFSKVARLYGTSTDNVQASNLDKEARNLKIGDYLTFVVPKKSLRGYLLPINKKNIEKNRMYAQQRTPQEFLEDRETFGRGLIKYLGIVPGDLEYNEDKIVENFEQLKPLILKYSKKHGMNYRTIAAICKQESGFRKWTSSETGSYSACGHTKDTYGGEHYMAELKQWKEKSNPYNLDQHIEETVKEYKQNVRMFSGKKKLALAAYNQGRGKVYRALKRVAKKRGLKTRKISTHKLVEFLEETGKGNGGFVNEVLRELPDEGKKYPTLVLNNIGWLSEKGLI